MAHLAINDMAAGFGYLKPLHVANAFTTFLKCILNGVFNAFLGRPDNLHFFVHVMVRH